jgi:hypothetical protein
MIIRIEETPYSSLTFYKGELEVNNEVRIFQVTKDENKIEKRKKLNFYAEGAKFTEIEKTEILMSFNEMLGQQINENIIEE